MADDVVVTVEGGGEETPPVVQPVIVETPAPAAGDSAIVVFTLEQLAERIVSLETEMAAVIGRFESVNGRLDNHSERIVELEFVEPEPEPVEEEIVTEVIPAAAVVETETPEPKARKRRFV